MVVLLVLLVISVAGPFLGHVWVTLVTAFGVAGVKAFLVAKHFMHLNVQKPVVIYILATVLVFMVLLFADLAAPLGKGVAVSHALLLKSVVPQVVMFFMLMYWGRVLDKKGPVWM